MAAQVYLESESSSYEDERRTRVRAARWRSLMATLSLLETSAHVYGELHARSIVFCVDEACRLVRELRDTEGQP